MLIILTLNKILLIKSSYITNILSINKISYLGIFSYLFFLFKNEYNDILLNEDRLFFIIFIISAMLGFLRQLLLFMISAGFKNNNLNKICSLLSITVYALLCLFIIYIEKKYLRNIKPRLNRDQLKEAGITQKESLIIFLLHADYTNNVISSILKISPSTVRNHIQNIYRKFDITNRLDLLKLLKTYECS